MSKKVLKKYGGAADANTVEYKYIIEKIDFDGDGTIDGILIRKYTYDKVNNKLISLVGNKFVPNAKVEKASRMLQQLERNTPSNFAPVKKAPVAQKRKNTITYSGEQIYDIETGRKQMPRQQYVAVQDNTTFGQNIQNGLGFGIGFGVGQEATSQLMDALFGE